MAGVRIVPGSKTQSGETNVSSSQPATVRLSGTETSATPPTSESFLASKVSKIPGATRGLTQYLREATEMYEGQSNPPTGTITGSPAGGSSFIEHARLYPNNTMGIKLKTDPIEYVHNIDPGFVPYAAEMIKSGDFYGEDYNRLKSLGVLKPSIGSENLPENKAAYDSFIAKEKARLGL